MPAIFLSFKKLQRREYTEYWTLLKSGVDSAGNPCNLWNLLKFEKFWNLVNLLDSEDSQTTNYWNRKEISWNLWNLLKSLKSWEISLKSFKIFVIFEIHEILKSVNRFLTFFFVDNSKRGQQISWSYILKHVTWSKNIHLNRLLVGIYIDNSRYIYGKIM